MNDSPAGDGVVRARGFEVGTALLLLAVAALIIADSLRVGIGWAADGPKAGYFPFYIGVLLALSAGWVLVSTLVRWRRDDDEFAQRSQLARVFAVGVPTALYAVLVGFIGLYVASFILIAYFMRRYGKYGWAATVGVSAGVPLAFFLVFEKWFLVPLPKGPLEALFGM